MTSQASMILMASKANRKLMTSQASMILMAYTAARNILVTPLGEQRR